MCCYTCGGLSLFVEHPLYLPRWVDGYFQMLDLTSEMIASHLGPIVQGGQVEDVQINLQETTFLEIFAVQEEPINQSAQQTLPSKHPSQKNFLRLQEVFKL